MNDNLEPIRRVFRNVGLYNHAADDLLCQELAAVAAPQPQAESAAKPLAWYVPHLLTFKNAERTNCPPELQGELEGQVAWEASLIGDGHPVTDKYGVTHRPIPLYAAPQPQASPQADADDVRIVGEFCRGTGGVERAWQRIEADMKRLLGAGRE